jgi:hypothetical protein
VTPRCFGAISAYDGDAAQVGRIVCDATWHHFVNINLNGAGGTPDTTSAPRTGMYIAGNPTPEYLKIQRYYLNTVRWLAPIGRRLCWPWIVAAVARFDYEVLELQLPHPHPCPWDPLIRIGTVVDETLTRYWGPGALGEIVDDLLITTKASPALARIVKARRAAQGDEREKEESLLPLQDLRRAIFGSVVNVIARDLPEDEAQLEKLLRDLTHDRVEKLMAEGVRGAEQSILEYVQRAYEKTGSEIGALRAGGESKDSTKGKAKK